MATKKKESADTIADTKNKEVKEATEVKTEEVVKQVNEDVKQVDEKQEDVKQVNEVVKQVNEKQEVVKQVDEKQVLIKKEIYADAEAFMEKYGGLNFDKIKYRPGAQFTDPFGLTERYKTINEKTVWGYPGIHTGTDRGTSTALINGINNPVVSPFFFFRSNFLDDGGSMYGTVCSLFHEKGFVMKICHMYPNKILVLANLKNNLPVSEGQLIGSAGDYGFSYGVHTHTDIESYNKNKNDYEETSQFLDAILEIKYGDDATKEYNDEEIFQLYAQCSMTKDWKEDEILKDYKEIRNYRGVLFLNKYKYTFKNYSLNKTYTRYGSRYLFDF